MRQRARRYWGFPSEHARESVKIIVRSALYRRDLDLARNPHPRRVTAALEWFRLSTVVDVGANVGQYGTALRASGFAGRIVSCEPVPGAYGRLARRIGDDLAWTGIETAVGAQVGLLDINVSANSYSSSIRPMTDAHRRAAPGSAYVGAVSVPVTTVRDLVADERIDPRQSLLKIDTQGYESEVLDGAGDLLGQFAAVQLELSFVPLYDSQQLFPELTRRMESVGYVMWGVEGGFSDRRTGRTLQCDGLFVAKWVIAERG